jgi:hypothetical protein
MLTDPAREVIKMVGEVGSDGANALHHAISSCPEAISLLCPLAPAAAFKQINENGATPLM